MSRKNIAIIGTGIAGLGCAHFLYERHHLTLFEKNDYAGGHTNTVTVEEDGRELPVDTGFMVFNHVTYPHLTRLFKQLDVATQRTDMSFSVRHDPTGIEYNGRNLKTVFGQRRNLFSPRFWRFVLKIHRFNQETVAALDDPRFATMNLEEYARVRGYGQDFLDLYVVPMGSAVWSTPPDQMLKFPAATLMRFWYNHGFLGMKTRHPWWTVTNGSRSYVKKLTAPFRDRVQLRRAAVQVRRHAGGASVRLEDGSEEHFDGVILACHADQAFRLLADPTPLEQSLLPAFRYQPNTATLHTDDRFMPTTRRCWASWNYHIRPTPEGGAEPSTHYWMNNLQRISARTNYFVSINGAEHIAPEKILKTISYEHPLFDVPAIEAQKRLPELNQISPDQNTWYCGSYFRYGFHEDAFGSAVNLCRELLGQDPW